MNCRSLWHTSSLDSIIKEELLHRNGDESVLLEARYSMISTGTERLVSQGKVPNSLYEKMKVPYMRGDFNLPIKYGYSMVAAGDQDMFHVMHPHQSRIDVLRSECFKIQTVTHAHRYALISNMETVLNAYWDAEISDQDTVAIIGFGNIGSLLAVTLKHYFEIECCVIETDPWRFKKAKELGFDVRKMIGDKYDIIFHSSATSEGMQVAIDHLNLEGKLIELSWYGSKAVQLSLGHSFHYNRIKIISSQVSQIPKHKSKQESYLSRKKLAAEILNLDVFDLLISDMVEFEDTPSFFKKLRSGTLDQGLIWIIKY